MLNDFFVKNLYEIDSDFILQMDDPTGHINNVIVGIKKHCYALAIDESDPEEVKVSLVFIAGNRNLRGHILIFQLLDQNRSSYIATYSRFLEQEYQVNTISTFNTYQGQIRTTLEKLGHFTLTDTDLDMLGQGTTYIKGKKSAQYTPFLNDKEILSEFFSSSPKVKEGFKYVYIQMNDIGHTKIGRSMYPHQREKTLQSQQPDVLLLAYWEAPPEIETLLHKKFSSKRLRGEWFNLNMNDFNDIKEFMKPYARH